MKQFTVVTALETIAEKEGIDVNTITFETASNPGHLAIYYNIPRPNGSVWQLTREALILQCAAIWVERERAAAAKILTTAYECMNYLGDTLNGMDAVEDDDEEYTNPRFDAVRAALEGYGVDIKEK